VKMSKRLAPIALALAASAASAQPPASYVLFATSQDGRVAYFANPSTRQVYRNTNSPGQFITTIDEYTESGEGKAFYRMGYNCGQRGVSVSLGVVDGVLAYGDAVLFQDGTIGMAGWELACPQNH
jgi:hypothetical protein